MHRRNAQGITVVQIHRELVGARSRRGGRGPDLTSVRRALKGNTFKRSKVETRGRKRALSNVNMRALDAPRKRLIKDADSQFEVHRDDGPRSGQELRMRAPEPRVFTFRLRPVTCPAYVPTFGGGAF